MISFQIKYNYLRHETVSYPILDTRALCFHLTVASVVCLLKCVIHWLLLINIWMPCQQEGIPFPNNSLICFFGWPNMCLLAVISQGVNAGDVKKLQDAGIYTCNGLMMHTKKVLKKFREVLSWSIMCSNMSLILFGPMQHLTGIKGLSEAKVDKICEAAEKIVVRAPLMHYKNVHLTNRKSSCGFSCMHNFFLQNFGYITGSDALLRVSSQSMNVGICTMLLWTHGLRLVLFGK